MTLIVDDPGERVSNGRPFLTYIAHMREHEAAFTFYASDFTPMTAFPRDAFDPPAICES